ncbi:MAG TPA: arsenic resistance N-acetyltransferase ArsN2 [Burkholderiaceae bacterium]|nr:arsenic resistance N-acetyltransferase ArsN2 [Burkholderiaceae bacterium]
MIATAIIRAAQAEDWPRVRSLLSGAGLPTIDLTTDSLSDFLVAADAGEVVGIVAVERCDEHGLLRSLVVDPAWRGTGLGRALVSAAEDAAARRELHSLTLLTQTAATFFRSLDYHDIARNDAPAAVRATTEFTHLCPSSSTCLTKRVADMHHD